MVEQLLEDDMGFTLEGEGNILRKGDKVFDAWKSVDRWFWCITHRFEPRVIDIKDEFGQEKNTYILDGIEKVAWDGLKYRHDWHEHREKLIGEAMAHLIETDKEDRAYLQPDDTASTLLEIAKDLIAVANEDSQIPSPPPNSPAVLEERKVEETKVKVL